ncbi:MAG: NAD(+) diphosphatase [Boseongicola sp.]
MKNAESVTFGGSGLDRAAELRGQPEVLAMLVAEPSSGVLPIWRGKPLLAADTRSPIWLPVSHAVLGEADGAAIFLGKDAGVARFAQDISQWEPINVAGTVGAFSDPSEQAHPALPASQVFCELRANMTHLTPREAELAATAKAILGWHETHGYCARCGAKSQIIEAGWQRKCDDCSAMHFPRTDPVVIMLITHGNSVLVGRSPEWPDGMYSLLAGFVEPGETIEAAVRRETFEEAGIAVGPVEYLSSQPWPFPSSLMIGCRGRALGRELTIDPNEIEDALWVTKEKMMDALTGADPELKPARKGSIARFLIENWLADTLD